MTSPDRGPAGSPAGTDRRPPLLVIGGATATGKTGLSIRIAEALMAEGVMVEIVSADSRQVYRGLDIGTAKASAAERARVPHHGLDLVDPDEPFSAGAFVRRVEPTLRSLGERSIDAMTPALAVLVGGTGLYLRAVARGLDVDALPADPVVRAGIEADLAAAGLAAAVDRLRRVAPNLATSVDLHNPRRVARALEIALLRGDGPRPAAQGYPAPTAWLGLRVEPEVHRARIRDRAQAQFDAGLLAEAAALRRRYDPGLPAFSAFGYREAFDVLDGRRNLAEANEVDTGRTWAFAQRQRTWFRGEPEMTWLSVDPGQADPLPAALVIARGLIETQPPPTRAAHPEALRVS